MELKNKLIVGLMSAMLAFTGLACASDDTTEPGTDGGVEAPADGGVEAPAGGATGGDLAPTGGATP